MRQHHDARSGCILVLASFPIAVLLLKFLLNLRWGASILSGYFAMLGVTGFVTGINWLRWRKQNRTLRVTVCPSCGGGDFTNIGRAAGKLWPCPFCKAKSLKCSVAGMS